MSFKSYYRSFKKYYHDHVFPNLPLLVAVIQTSIVSLSLITATKTQHQAITISKSAEPDTDGWGFYLLYISLVTFWLPWMFILYTHHKKKGNQPKWIYFFHRVFAFFNVLAYVAIVFIRLDLNVKIHEIAANTFFASLYVHILFDWIWPKHTDQVQIRYIRFFILWAASWVVGILYYAHNIWLFPEFECVGAFLLCFYIITFHNTLEFSTPSEKPNSTTDEYKHGSDEYNISDPNNKTLLSTQNTYRRGRDMRSFQF